MRRRVAAAVLASFVLAWAAPASAAPTRIGMITTLTGGGGQLGREIRDGFQLALDQGEGALGGQPVELLVRDDKRSKERAMRLARELVQERDVAVLTGLVWSNLALQVVPWTVERGRFYISPNAGPAELAGEGCHRNYFNVAWQNDNLHEAAGRYLSDEGFERVVLLAPDYAAGYDALTGFKRYYRGTVAAEIYVPLGQTDHRAQLARIRELDPDAVYFFYPGRMGITFTKAYNRAGLRETTPLFGPAFNFDQRSLEYMGRYAIGSRNSAQWSPDLDNPANRQFVKAFRAKYGRVPSVYASQGYDAARLIGSALAATDGKVDGAQAAFRQALRAGDFESVRGDFRFGANHHPIQDIYMRKIVRTSQRLTNRVVATVFEDHRDAYAKRCSME